MIETKLMFLYESGIREELRKAVKFFGSQKACARKFGISQAFMSDMLKGRREVSDRVAHKLGFTREAIYKPLSKETPHG